MSQCVPRWDIDDCNNSARLSYRAEPNTDSAAPDDSICRFDYEVAELTWENGQLAMHGLGPPRPAGKPISKYTWEKPRAGGTLESIVDQANFVPPQSGDELGTWFDHQRTSMDALVPDNPTRVSDSDPTQGVVGSSTRVGSCSEAVGPKEAAAAAAAAVAAEASVAAEAMRKRTRVARAALEGSSCNKSASASRHVTMDTYEMGVDVGFTSTSLGSHNETSSRKPLAVDDHDSVCHSRPQREAGSEDEKKGKKERSSISTKRSRAAAIHNQSERKRRDRINQRMKTLQKLVPNSSKTDKASMLDEVIEYLKQLQAQVQMMSKMSSMMMPMAMQQLQMSMMAQMGMGMGMGLGVMDMNSINRSGHAAATIPPMLHPAAFLPLTAAWDGSGDRLQPSTTILADPFSAFLACQTQPMNLDAYNRMAALYQQLHQSAVPPPPNSRS